MRLSRILALLLAGVILLPALGSHAQDNEAEIEFWQSVKDSESVHELGAYLEVYPEGKFAPLAHIRLRELKVNDPSGSEGKAANSSDVSAEGIEAKPEETASDPRKEVVVMTLDAWPRKPSAPRIGATITRVPKAIAKLFGVEPHGVLVQHVSEGTPAEDKGIGPGTVIVSWNDVPVRDPAALVGELRKSKPGQTVSIGILRLSKTTAEYEQVLRAGAADGNSDAMMQLALGLAHGTFTSKDKGETVRWYKKAADLGHKQAIERLSKLGVSEYKPVEGDAAPNLDDIGDLD